MALTFNEDLHARLDAAVRSGAAVVVDAPDAAGQSLAELLVRNRNDGKDLFAGISVFRGSKDPDVDTGTFVADRKHATLHFAVARGYAENANQNIGLVDKDTAGIGVIGEYDLPADAVFHRNFGLEGSADGKHGPGMSVNEARQQLQPLVDAYAVAPNDVARRAARQAIDAFCGTFLYELALPVSQEPTRRWVTQHDDVNSRLIQFDDRGKVGSVLIDVVRARKHAVDAFNAKPLLRELGQLARDDSLDAVRADLRSTIARAGDMIEAQLEVMRASDFAVPHTSVAQAIAWRKDVQRNMRIERLTNSGATVVHENAQLRAVAQVADAADSLVRGAYDHAWQGKRQEILGVIEAGAAKSEERATRKDALDVADASSAKADNLLGRARSARDEAESEHSVASAAHRTKLQSGLVGRLIYRFGGDQKRAESHLIRLLSGLNAKQDLCERIEKRREAISVTVDRERASLSQIDSDLKGLEQTLREHAREGDLTRLTSAYRGGATALDASGWKSLLDDARVNIRQADVRLEESHAAASLMARVAARGLAGVTGPGSPGKHAGHASNASSPDIEALTMTLVERGEDPTLERIESLAATIDWSEVQRGAANAPYRDVLLAAIDGVATRDAVAASVPTRAPEPDNPAEAYVALDM